MKSKSSQAMKNELILCRKTMKTLILTPNKNEMCGMYQLAKDLAKEFNGDILTKKDKQLLSLKNNLYLYNKVITLLYPMHNYGQLMKKRYKSNVKWICYDQKIPSITKTYFPNFWRRQIMKYINWRNNATMQYADEYWDVTEREQKPRWTEKRKLRFNEFGNGISLIDDYAIYIGRTTDYKNFEWLQRTLNEMGIRFIHPQNISDELLCEYLSNAKMLVTASIWEGFGRSVMEAEALGIPAVAYDVGAHKRHIKKGICVPVGNEEEFKRAVLKVWNRK